jgi:hypothetical protein
MQYASFPYDQQVYNGSLLGVTTYLTDSVVFEGFSLDDRTYMTVENILHSGPGRQLISGDIPRDDGQYLIADYWREKIITVPGYMKNTTSTLLEAYKDTVKRNLRKRGGILDITRNGVVRRYIATLTNMDELFGDQTGQDITFCPFLARFTCKQGKAKDRDYTVDSVTFASASPIGETVVTTGSDECKPVIIFLFDTASAVTGCGITNTTTGEQITYTGSVAAGDLIIFDSELKSVTKNAVAVDYSGAFPTLDVGSNVLSHAITGGAFTGVVTVKWKNTYL